MPIEEMRNIYLGKTATHVNVYLGAASAKFAQFLYEKAGTPFELLKTDIFASIDDFSYLVSINAVAFKNNRDDTASELKTLLETYDVLKRHTLIHVAERPYRHTDVYNGRDIVFRNNKDGITLFIRSTELPEYKDSILTCLDWDNVGGYVSSSVEQFCHILCDLFHKKIYNRRSELFDKICAFKKLYLS